MGTRAKIGDSVYVIDTSVVIEGYISKLIGEKKINGRIIIPRVIIGELENQANNGQETGFLGLDEIQKLQELKNEGIIELSFAGDKPNMFHIEQARFGGEVDSLVRDLAFSEGATLITADKVQSHSAKAFGIEVLYLHHQDSGNKLLIEKYFDEETMSVHIKEDCKPKAKRGKPGEWRLDIINEKETSQPKVQEFAKDIVERARIEHNAFVEISRPGSTIVQYKDYRIVIAKPPVSDGWEITAVRPIKILKLEDYSLPDKIAERIKKQARGVIIAGTTGSGKCLEKNTPVYSKEFGKININYLLNKCDYNGVSKQYKPKRDITLLGINREGKLSNNKLKRVILRNVNSLFNLKTKSGKSIDATEEHPFLIFRENEGARWISLKDIKEGDFIATPERLEFNENKQKLDIIRKLNENTMYALCKINKDLPCYMKYKIHKGERNILKFIFEKNMNKFNIKDIKIYSKSRLEVLIKNLVIGGFIKKIDKEQYSLNHRFYKFRGNQWLSMNDINSKYLIAKISEKDILLLKNIGKNSRESLSIKPVYETSPELIKILAYLNSEGTRKFGISNTSQEILNEFFECTKKVFGIDKTNFKKYGDTYCIEASETLFIFFKNLLNYESKSKSKSFRISFPRFFANLSIEEKKCYLRCYFDAESSVSDKDIELTSASLKHINEINNLLLSLNIQGRISKKTTYARNSKNPKIRDYWRLSISGSENLDRYKTEIGYLLEYKKEKLNNIIKENGITNVDSLPAYNLLKKIKGLLGDYDFRIYSHSNYSKRQLKKILPKIYKELNKHYENLENSEDLIGKLSYISNWKNHLLTIKENIEKNNISITKFSKNQKVDHTCLKNWLNITSEPRMGTLCKIMNNSQYLPMNLYNNGINKIDNEFKVVLNSMNILNTELEECTNLSQQEFSHLRKNSFLAAKPSSLTNIKWLLYKKIKNFKQAEELTSQIYFLANSEIFWDKVKSINKKTGKFSVYDVEIEDSHNFIAGDNPIISHNSTFCQSLGEYYSEHNFVTKTVESPRSLILSKDITQYSKNLASSEEIHDILFLSRPDYILFDEMRNTPDFELYTDLRLGGSNVLGVLHAATPIDAVQRFISRMDVGMIPSVLDTLIFIDKGTIGKIMTVKMSVKVPSGMTEADLARPVVEVKDYITNSLEFEIYSYGEQTVVVPITENSKVGSDPSKKLAAKQIENMMKKYTDKIRVNVISNNKAEIYVPESSIARIIGKEGKTINQIEKEIGIGLDVKSLNEHNENSVEDNEMRESNSVRFETEETNKAVIFRLPSNCSGSNAEVYVDNHFLLAYTVGKAAEIKINKKSKLGQELLKDIKNHRDIEIRV